MVTLQLLHSILMRLDFPSTKDELIRQAQHLGEPDEVLTRLRTLPEHDYGSVDSVMDALRGME